MTAARVANAALRSSLTNKGRPGRRRRGPRPSLRLMPLVGRLVSSHHRARSKLVCLRRQCALVDQLVCVCMYRCLSSGILVRSLLRCSGAKCKDCLSRCILFGEHHPQAPNLSCSVTCVLALLVTPCQRKHAMLIDNNNPTVRRAKYMPSIVE